MERHQRPREGRSYSSATESDISASWSDTGDIGEQFADEEDPLHIELNPLDSQGRSVEKNTGRGGVRGKKVSFKDADNTEGDDEHFGTGKESIYIPSPPPRQIPVVEKILAVIMAPNDIKTAKSRGLVGKPLL